MAWGEIVCPVPSPPPCSAQCYHPKTPSLQSWGFLLDSEQKSYTCLLISKDVVGKSEHRNTNQLYKLSSQGIKTIIINDLGNYELLNTSQMSVLFEMNKTIDVKCSPFWCRKGLCGDWIKGQCVCATRQQGDWYAPLCFQAAQTLAPPHPQTCWAESKRELPDAYWVGGCWAHPLWIPCTGQNLYVVMVCVALMISESVDEPRHVVQAKAISPLPREFNFYNVHDLNVPRRSKDYQRR